MPCFAGGVDYSTTTDFDFVSVERRLEGRRIESVPDQGWAFHEIDRIDERAGGSPKAHVDALKLLAVFLAHWDNKAENQRLLCLPGGDRPDGSCSRPFAILQDLGASFGPNKLDLHNWRSRPVWSDARRCRVTMKDMPWNGATFPDQAISEGGRAFLLSLLAQLSTSQVEDLFAGSRVELSEGVTAEEPSAGCLGGGFRRQGAADSGGGALFMKSSTRQLLQGIPTPNLQGSSRSCDLGVGIGGWKCLGLGRGLGIARSRVALAFTRGFSLGQRPMAPVPRPVRPGARVGDRPAARMERIAQRALEDAGAGTRLVVAVHRRRPRLADDVDRRQRGTPARRVAPRARLRRRHRARGREHRSLPRRSRRKRSTPRTATRRRRRSSTATGSTCISARKARRR